MLKFRTGTLLKFLAIVTFIAAGLNAQQNRLLVISIDGLDQRWLRDADELGMEIPTLRRLMREGALADGVVGVVPTVTWPSHTTMITGVSPERHGIVSNNQPGKPGQRWWHVGYLKTITLWHLTHRRALPSAAVWWPVTVGADINFNLPEFWEDPEAYPRLLAPVAEQSTAGLIERIRVGYPSFGRQHFNDRQKVLAARYILENEKPVLFLLHLGDLDSEQHATGAFSSYAKATLEYQDDLLAELFEVLPERTYVTIVSDHGFETQHLVVRPEALLAQEGIDTGVEVAHGIFGVTDDRAADYFRALAAEPKTPIAREVPMEEVRRFAQALDHWEAAFEPIQGVMAIEGSGGPPIGTGDGRGHHGLWPTREGYRAAFLLWGPEVAHKTLPEISMLNIAPTFADILGIRLPQGEGKSLWDRVQ